MYSLPLLIQTKMSTPFSQAILTHKGRSSNSGHYVAWVKQKGDTWLECNDDDVRPIHEEDIMKLSGGGKISIISNDLKAKTENKTRR